MIAGIPARTAARNGTRSRARRVRRDARTTGSSSWESASDDPCPGKCFPTGTTPASREPCAQATPSAAAVSGSDEIDRSPTAQLRTLSSTSSTGAKLMSIPTTAISAAAARPALRAVASPRGEMSDRLRAGGNCVNSGSLSRRTRPPSWSIAMSGAGWPRPAAARTERHSSRTWPGPPTFRENRTTPPTVPSRSHLARCGGTDVPSNPTMRRGATPDENAVRRFMRSAGEKS